MILKLLLNIQTIWLIFVKHLRYNLNKKQKILIAFDYMIADLLSNKRLSPIVTELFIKGRKLNISLAFITPSYFAVPKDIRLNATHYFIVKGPNKQKLKQIASQNLSDIGIEDFMNLYKKRTEKPHFFGY